MNTATLHFYRAARAHQLATYSKDGLFIDGVDQRQFTGGGAAYGFHAYAAFLSPNGKSISARRSPQTLPPTSAAARPRRKQQRRANREIDQ